MQLLNPRTWIPVVFALGCEWTLAQDPQPAPAELPDMASIKDVGKKKETFFNFLNPIVENVNHRIEAERTWLRQMRIKAREGHQYLTWQTELMRKLGRYYEVDAEPGTAAYFDTILHRADTLPASMVLAQAAIESAWGTSRFAVEGNNLFGQWCFREGCGLVPNSRPEGESYEVRLFDSVTDSVDAYFQNVNTHPQYRDLRNIRAELRYLSVPVSSLELVWGLEGYSARGEEYIRELVQMIKYNKLSRFDQVPHYALN